MKWVLVWIQIISGMPAEYFQLGVYESEAICKQIQQEAKIMVTHNGIAVACLKIEL
jgi:hypothetical protein|tara:strand:- start:621 stop:788 length:168 start_codon:yes stop_codon:yes gene_type:complete